MLAVAALRPDWLLEINLACASVATAACFYAAAVGDKDQRRRHAIVGCLAALYALFTGAQAVSPDPGSWLTAARAFGPLVWVIVWIWPPIASVWRFRRLKTELTQAVMEARAGSGPQDQDGR